MSTVAERLIVEQAESIVRLEEISRTALASLTDAQLRALLWVGLVDEGWSRLYAELDRRGVTL